MTVSGPLMERIPASYVQLDKTRAVMEMAAASGHASCSRGKNVTQGRPQPSEPAR